MNIYAEMLLQRKDGTVWLVGEIKSTKKDEWIAHVRRYDVLTRDEYSYWNVQLTSNGLVIDNPYINSNYKELSREDWKKRF